MAELPFVQIYSDGSTAPMYPGDLPNPGRGGWGAVMVMGDRVRAIYGTLPFCSNNYAEGMAMVNALATLRKRCRVHVFTDSNYVANGFKRVIQAVHRDLPNSVLLDSNHEVWVSLRPLVEQHSVTLSHVAGHSTVEYNELADEIAKLGSQYQESGSFYLNQLEVGSPEDILVQKVSNRIAHRKAKLAQKRKAKAWA